MATLGRLVNFLEEGSTDISGAGYVVLDEVDHMLDKGFEDAIKTILSRTPPMLQRQTLIFTATWLQSVHQLTSSYMMKPVKISINSLENGNLCTNIQISQTVHILSDPRSKESYLLNIIYSYQ